MTMGGILVITSLASGFLFRSKKLAAATFLFPVFLLWGIYGYAFKAPITSDTVYYKKVIIIPSR